MRSEHSVLFVSKPKLTGTGLMRGGQVAATRSNWHWTGDRTSVQSRYDFIVGIKKWSPEYTKGASAPYRVFDPLDFWPQSVTGAGIRGATTDRTCLELFRAYVEKLKIDPDGFIFVNRKMYSVMKEAFPSKPSALIYHHSDPASVVNPIRKEAKTVVFEGLERNLGDWRYKIEAVCRKFGMSFVINPSRVWGQSLAMGDIAISVRDGAYDSYISRQFKSNVKMANVYASGTPCIMWPECGTVETAIDGVQFFENEKELAERLDWLRSYDRRLAIHKQFLHEARKYHIGTIAGQYDTFFDTLRTN